MAKYNSNLRNRDNGRTISLDLDGVSTRTRDAFLSHIEKEYNISISRDVLYGTDPQIPGTDLKYGEAVQEIASNTLDVYKHMDPIPGASDSTLALSREYNIKIVTHRVSENWLPKDRREEMKDISITWLEDNKFYFDDFVYPTPDEKTDVDADIYIDDRPQIIEKVDDKGREGILFLRPHNTKYIPNSVTSAAEFSDYTVNNLSSNPDLQWSIITEKLINS
jgi:5'(3')-deoxyribonucleotidase